MSESELAYHHLRCRMEQDVLVLMIAEKQLQGDDLADALRQEFYRAIEQFQAKKVVLDFRDVEYLASAGFRPLLSLHRKLRDQGGAMVFCNLSPGVTEVFQVTRLISSSRSSTAPFEMAPTPAEALARLRYFILTRDRDALILTVTEPRLDTEQRLDNLRQDLLSTVAQLGAQMIALDLHQVEAVAPACIPLLLDLCERLRQTVARVVLCRLQPAVADALAAGQPQRDGGSAGGLDVAPDVSSAIALLNNLDGQSR